MEGSRSITTPSAGNTVLGQLNIVPPIGSCWGVRCVLSGSGSLPGTLRLHLYFGLFTFEVLMHVYTGQSTHTRGVGGCARVCACARVCVLVCARGGWSTRYHHCSLRPSRPTALLHGFAVSRIRASSPWPQPRLLLQTNVCAIDRIKPRHPVIISPVAARLPCQIR